MNNQHLINTLAYARANDLEGYADHMSAYKGHPDFRMGMKTYMDWSRAGEVIEKFPTLAEAPLADLLTKFWSEQKANTTVWETR